MTAKKMKKPGNPYKQQCKTIRNIAASRAFGIEKAVMLGTAAMLMCMPAMAIRYLGGKAGYLGRKIFIEVYAAVKPVALLILLASGRSTSCWAHVWAAWSMTDLLLYLSGLVFLAQHYTSPASYRRSVMLLFGNWCELILGFAVLYHGNKAISFTAHNEIPSWIDAVYFSVAVSATIGFGDIIPSTIFGRALVIFQAFATFFLVAVVFTYFMGALGQQGKHDGSGNTNTSTE